MKVLTVSLALLAGATLTAATVPPALASAPSSNPVAMVKGGDDDDCNAPSKKTVEGLFDGWNAALKTLDPERVADRYAKKSVLLATLASKPRDTREGRIEYFTEFLKKKPVGTINERWITTDCNSAVDAGTYTFAFGDGTSVAARYTFTYVREAGQWKISSHHSSAMPKDH